MDVGLWALEADLWFFEMQVKVFAKGLWSLDLGLWVMGFPF